MKIRLANKIIKTWTDATDSRYFDSEYDIKESKAFNRFAALYRRAIQAGCPRINAKDAQHLHMGREHDDCIRPACD